MENPQPLQESTDAELKDSYGAEPTAKEIKALENALDKCQPALPGGPEGQLGASAIVTEEQDRELQKCLAEAGVAFDDNGSTGLSVGSPDQMQAIDSCFQNVSGDAPATSGTGSA